MKIKVKSILLQKLEGAGSDRPGKEVKDFWEASCLLSSWRRESPKGCGYDKTRFTITFEDGFIYEGRYDLQQEDLTTLSKHCTDFLSFYAGLRHPRRMTDEEYRDFLVGQRIDTESYRRMLDTYEWE